MTTKVRTVAITKPLIEGLESAEELVAYAARVSNPGNQMNTETAPKLLKYLLNAGHWSPFEMVHVVLEVETTRAIAHQIVRHRSFAFQEFSQRYADVGALGNMFEHSEARLQDTKNRQNSTATDDIKLQVWWDKSQKKITKLAKKKYLKGIEKGLAKEVVRNVLPEGLTKSRLYMAGSLRSWIHYIWARGPGSGTQKEHMEVAAGAKACILKHFPAIAELLENMKNG